MVKVKNWSNISRCGNKQLRLALIAATGITAEGLAKGFPEYFLSEGENQTPITWTRLMAIISGVDRKDEIVQIIADLEIPQQRFSFAGQRCGTTDGTSYAKGGYNTTANGWGDNFYTSTKRQGEVLEYKGAEWLVVWNGNSIGNAATFDRHSLVIIPVDAIEDDRPEPTPEQEKATVSFVEVPKDYGVLGEDE